MYQLTENERNTLHTAMVKLLDEYDYDYSHSSIDKIIDTWCENKSTLIEAFKTHPNYIDGKFLIAFESDYERDIDSGAILTFSNWIRNTAMYEMRNTLPEAFRDDCIRHNNFLPWDMWYFFTDGTFSGYRSRTVSEEFAERVKHDFPEVPVHTGEKTTRLINRIMSYLGYDKHSQYNREFAKYADALTPIKIKRHTVISLNPLDYLTMSFGNSWSSCHTIDKENKRKMPNSYEGCYSSGTVSYMLDSVSMVFYTVDATYNDTDYFTQPKINRQMYHYGEEKLVQGRLYPQSNDGANDMYLTYRQLMQELISNIFNFPNLWITNREGISKYVWSEGTHYKDYSAFDCCKMSRVKDSANDNTITIGHSPICIECGSQHSAEDNISCCRSEKHTCDHCGCVIDEDDGYYVGDYFYCSDCVSYCECCGNYELNENMTEVASGDYVCKYCLDDHYTRCDECGEYVRNYKMRDIVIDGYHRDICDDCIDNFAQCDDCGEWFACDDMTDGLCEECHKARQEDETEGE